MYGKEILHPCKMKTVTIEEEVNVIKKKQCRLSIVHKVLLSAILVMIIIVVMRDQTMNIAIPEEVGGMEGGEVIVVVVVVVAQCLPKILVSEVIATRPSLTGPVIETVDTDQKERVIGVIGLQVNINVIHTVELIVMSAKSVAMIPVVLLS